MQRKYSEVVNYIPNFQSFQLRRHSREPANNQKLSPVDIVRPSQNQPVQANNQYANYVPQNNIPKQPLSATLRPMQTNQRRSLPNYNLRVQANRPIQTQHVDLRGQNVNNFRNNGLIQPMIIQRRPQTHNLSSQSPQIINSPQNNFNKQKIVQINKHDMNLIMRNLHTTHTSPVKMVQQTQQRNINSLHSQNLAINTKRIQSPPNSLQSPTLYNPNQDTRRAGRVCQSMIISEPINNLETKYQNNNANLNSNWNNSSTNQNPTINNNMNNTINGIINYGDRSNGGSNSNSTANTRNNSVNDLKSLLTVQNLKKIDTSDNKVNSNNAQYQTQESKKYQYSKNAVNNNPNGTNIHNYVNIRQKKNEEVWKSAEFTINKNQSAGNLITPMGHKFLDHVKEKDEDFMKEVKKSIQNLKAEKRMAKTEIFTQPYTQQSSAIDYKFRKKNDNLEIPTSNSISHSSGCIKVSPCPPSPSKTMPQHPKVFTIDDFQIIQKLGKGTYGDVFLARERTSRFVCVLKSLSKKRIKQLGLEQHVFRQIKIQSYLVHRHITNLYGVFSDSTKIYLIMQCMPDGSMHSNGKKRISQSQVAFLVGQVCEGLLYMHRQDIIHRDIKPENLLLNNTYVKIGDFGCAVFGNTLRRTIVGSYAYMSPQQFSNNPYDEKIDSWCVGTLAYEMLTGKPPYQQKLRKMALIGNQNNNKIVDQKGQKVKQHRMDITETMDFPEVEFPEGSKISNQAIDFIKRLLDKDPIARADIRQALKHKFTQKAKQYQQYLEDQLQSKL